MIRTAIISFSLSMAAATAAVADAERGKQLHEQQCTKCHGDSVYTRDDRFIDSKAALTKQVKRCSLNVGARWFDEDIKDVVQFLDSSYYHFGE
jgi:mono/diheme cytochrome c family protein